ncbi:MAG: His/Gly/Thr/Pro-type tRNA ligase C-terminal domain-containing protein, partial [Candidatus Woesearchaeota archaeon]|nr:His/Gly/Thr/Pro-type tRNA ligase C-terminal domain-containing protein [Candidatus Woesearchaeota archaeon]
CPHHFMMYKSEVRSYKDLPLRIAELAHQYRYEKSGELSGLMRVRMFCLADAHIFAAVDQAKQVVKEVLDLIDYTNQIFGLIKGKDYVYRLSLGDRQDTKKYYKDNVAWDKAENVLREVLKEIKAPFYEAKNEAAFYGPKIDVQMKKVGNKEETAFTVQYDFVMPKRFDLKFMNKEGVEERPIVIHRSSIGAFERTMALLIEKYGGKFPLWLAPTQIILLTITDRNIEFTKKLKHEFEKYNLRVELNDKAETMSKKVRDAQLQKIPLILTIGDKEMENNTVSVRTSDGNTKFGIKIDDFIKKVVENIQKRSLTISF